MTTAIEWTDETWNPTTGCDRVSPGCAHCYIERTPPFRIEGRRFDEHGKMGVRLHPDRLDKPLHWRKPRRVFVNSLSDLFHPDIDDLFITQVFDTMAEAKQHTFQVLTKRPARMRAFVAGVVASRCEYAAQFELCPTEDMRTSPAARWAATWPNEPISPNVWLGTSIESDRYTFRADHLRATPAAVRFLSCEPLLGPLPSLDLHGIDWVIVGGESGPGARPMASEWAQEIVDRCRAAGVAAFVKQLGTRAMNGNPRADHHDIDTFPVGLRVREWPKAQAL